MGILGEMIDNNTIVFLRFEQGNPSIKAINIPTQVLLGIDKGLRILEVGTISALLH